MESSKDRLKDILLREKLVTPQDLERALAEQQASGGELIKILIKHNHIAEADIVRVFSEGLGLPLVNIARLKIEPKTIKVFTKELAEKHLMMPISLIGDRLTVAMTDPMNIFVIDSLKTLTGYEISPVVARVEDIKKGIEKYYTVETTSTPQKDSDSFAQIMRDLQDTEELELIKENQPQTGKGGVEEISEEAPIIKLTDTIIQQAVHAKASDVFIEPLEKCVRVRYRIDGVIREIDRMSKMLHFPMISRIKVISNLDISEHRLPQDGRFKTIIGGERAVDFRVSILPTALGEKAVLRILDQTGTVLDVDNLGFEAKALERLKACSARPHGMILTCGPTGSGKTTTLYSILKSVNTPGKNIVTVEDPVEYQMKGINQVNIKPSMGLTFSSSLRSILRQDPDIILIGEIRDVETLDIAVKAALTGHLVLSSLHTTTAAGSVIRMMNMGVEPFLICSSVLAIIAQRLLRKICPACKEAYELPKEVAKRVGFDQVTDINKKVELYKGKGCKACFNTGYKGRVGITEILTLSIKVKELILGRAGEFKIKEMARSEGMQTMREDALLKALAGLTSLEEVLRITANDE